MGRFDRFASCSLRDFTDVQELYRSGTGAVYRARFRYDEKLYVLKERVLSELGKRKNITNEVQLLCQLNHTNVIMCEGWFWDHQKGALVIVLEYCEDGDLFKLIQRRKARSKYLDEAYIWNLFHQICLAVQHLHQNGIIHRDLKALNVMLTRGCTTAKLGDLGVSRQVSEDTMLLKTFYGTPLYLSPELVDNSAYNEKTDIWSLGVLLYELAALRCPFRSQTLLGLAKTIKAGAFDPLPSHYSSALGRCVQWLLNVDYRRRPSINHVIEWVERRVTPLNLADVRENLDEDVPDDASDGTVDDDEAEGEGEGLRMTGMSNPEHLLQREPSSVPRVNLATGERKDSTRITGSKPFSASASKATAPATSPLRSPGTSPRAHEGKFAIHAGISSPKDEGDESSLRGAKAKGEAKDDAKGEQKDRSATTEATSSAGGGAGKRKENGKTSASASTQPDAMRGPDEKGRGEGGDHNDGSAKNSPSTPHRQTLRRTTGKREVDSSASKVSSPLPEKPIVAEAKASESASASGPVSEKVVDVSVSRVSAALRRQVMLHRRLVQTKALLQSVGTLSRPQEEREAAEKRLAELLGRIKDCEDCQRVLMSAEKSGQCEENLAVALGLYQPKEVQAKVSLPTDGHGSSRTRGHRQRPSTAAGSLERDGSSNSDYYPDHERLRRKNADFGNVRKMGMDHVHLAPTKDDKASFRRGPAHHALFSGAGAGVSSESAPTSRPQTAGGAPSGGWSRKMTHFNIIRQSFD